MRVKEIMKSPVVTVNKDATIKDCGMLLEKHHINGMPVVDEGRVIGVITRADIFKSILPTHLLQMIERYPEISAAYPEVKEIFERYPEMLGGKKYMDFGYIEGRIDRINKLKVTALMGRPAIILNSDTPLVKAGFIMVVRNIKQVPVVDEGKLVGIITLTDICRNLIERARER